MRRTGLCRCWASHSVLANISGRAYSAIGVFPLVGFDIHQCKLLPVWVALYGKGHATGCYVFIALNRKELLLVRGLAPVFNAGPELALRPQLAPGKSAGIPASRSSSAQAPSPP